MSTLLLILGSCVAAILVIGFGWRYASRVRQLPCPSRFAGSLEGSWSTAHLRTRETLDCLQLRPGMRVLELGPGPGRLLIPAAQRVSPGGEAVGVDVQSAMVERLLQRARAAGVGNLSAVVGDAAQPQVPPQSFDVVYLCMALGEIPDRQGALTQCYAALKPGGLLSITELVLDPHYQRQTPLRRMAEQAGFRLREIHGPRWFYTANFERPA